MTADNFLKHIRTESDLRKRVAGAVLSAGHAHPAICGFEDSLTKRIIGELLNTGEPSEPRQKPHRSPQESLAREIRGILRAAHRITEKPQYAKSIIRSIESRLLGALVKYETRKREL